MTVPRISKHRQVTLIFPILVITVFLGHVSICYVSQHGGDVGRRGDMDPFVKAKNLS